MEITEGHIDKFEVAKLILKPPILEGTVLDVEVSFKSKSMPVVIQGYLSLDRYGNYNPRSYGELGGDPVRISSSARRKIRKCMRQLVIQLLVAGEGDLERCLDLDL